jgi:organic radical activating enzyme
MRFVGVTKDATTAGPGKRLELFLKGCIRGIVNPCEDCFNPSSWEFGGLKKEMDIYEVVNMIDRDAWNRQVTFCGGEPLLQTRNLIKVCKILKEKDPRFHIVVYTAYILENLLANGIVYKLRNKDDESVQDALISYSSNVSEDKTKFIIAYNNDIKELMKYVDVIVDGDYQKDKRIPIEKYMDDGMFIGSSNQRIIFTQLSLKHYPNIVYLSTQEYQERRNFNKHCACCGHAITKSRKYCDAYCQKRYLKRKKEFLSNI